ncbi:hypothetical protein Droror1_Dr00014425 [Drosera rotundifolia]
MSNSTTTGLLGDDTTGGFTYGIGISVGVFLLISTITLTSYCCTRSIDQNRPIQHRRPTIIPAPSSSSHCAVDIGVDDATLMKYPKVVYNGSEEGGGSTRKCCSICLGKYKKKDVLRVLPDCGHVFHMMCVDPWLRINASCPVCRTSPLLTPMPTPLVEVTPLAGADRQPDV